MGNERKQSTRRELVGMGLVGWVLLSGFGDVALSAVFPNAGWGFYICVPVCVALYLGMNIADEWPQRERPRSPHAIRAVAALQAAGILAAAEALVAVGPPIEHTPLALGARVAMWVVATVGATVTLVVGLRQSRRALLNAA